MKLKFCGLTREADICAANETGRIISALCLRRAAAA